MQKLRGASPGVPQKHLRILAVDDNPAIGRLLQHILTTEKALRASEEGFRLLVQQVNEYAILLLDHYGYVASWNLGAERMKGCPADEILGQHVSRFYCHEDIALGKPQKALRAAAKEGRVIDESWRAGKGGSRFGVSVRISEKLNSTLDIDALMDSLVIPFSIEAKLGRFGRARAHKSGTWQKPCGAVLANQVRGAFKGSNMGFSQRFCYALPKNRDAMKLDILLQELHAERRWLECLITALEAAAHAPDLAEPLATRLNHIASGGRVGNLPPEKKAELERLARRVRRVATRRSPPPAPGPRLVHRKPRTGGGESD
ncbi:MAG: PAS domain S-box protein [Acidobacteria bacterium]|nr:PAS domain S-box protein [Acidobacteriota bacterium]